MMATRLYTRPFVGIVGDGTRKVFRSIGRPGNGVEGQYVKVVGPFKTTRGAEYLVSHPELSTTLPVRGIERLAASSPWGV